MAFAANYPAFFPFPVTIYRLFTRWKSPGSRY